MKKFELINKSVFMILFFILLVIYSYVHKGYSFLLILSIILGFFFWFLGRFNYIKFYFKFVLLNVLIVFFYVLGGVYLTIIEGWGIIFVFLLLFFLIDFSLSIKKIKRMQKHYKLNNTVIDNNLDNYTHDFEVEHGKVWGDGIFFQFGLISYMFVIGPYFIIINSPFYFDAGGLMLGIKSNAFVYFGILLMLILWEYSLKRFYFFSGLEYKFKNE
ncbi:hypothetical protein [Acinetobacter indicus]|uniref:Uncharacterized protein n=1 Tax=Acinetobacter indicus TaxID=756892 RepID=A0A6C0Y4Q7_9GAMM|nr:hypothetical protein [Acinetobacter indicus]QIC71108.1 hypothetical protein FSC09_12160 [Acinetobacter indicus]